MANHAHNCRAESNVRRLGMYDRGDETITEWGCKRCPTTWETVTSVAQMQAEHAARLREQVAEIARRHGG